MFKSSSQYIRSYYSDTTSHLQLHRSSLKENCEVDVCIIGAGYLGLHCALELARSGKSVVVLESSRVGWGASGRNGGQMIIGFPCGMQRLKAAIGYERARNMFDASRKAVHDMRSAMERYGIACDMREGHLEVAVLQRRVADLTGWIEECNSDWAYDRLKFVERKDLPTYINSPRYKAGIFNPEGAHIHPLKFVLGLASAAESEGARIYEQTKAERYEEKSDRVLVHTARAIVSANQVILACNAYVDGLDDRLSSRTLPVGTFIVATKAMPESRARSLLPKNTAVYDNQFILEYFRLTADHRLLFGGKCSYLGGTPLNLSRSMRANVLRAFPQLDDVEIEYAWGGHIDVTLSRMPDWGRRGDRVFWAQGFCGHGLVPTKVASELIVEAVLGNPERLDWFQPITNVPIPFGETFGGLMQAAGMAYYRVRDFV